MGPLLAGTEPSLSKSTRQGGAAVDHLERSRSALAVMPNADPFRAAFSLLERLAPRNFPSSATMRWLVRRQTTDADPAPLLKTFSEPALL